jgi:hypothetical protein
VKIGKLDILKLFGRKKLIRQQKGENKNVKPWGKSGVESEDLEVSIEEPDAKHANKCWFLVDCGILCVSAQYCYCIVYTLGQVTQYYWNTAAK